jgi:cytochrome P450
MSTATNPVEFDPFSDAFFNDPTEMYRRLRDEAPVYFSEKYGFYALSRFADVLAAHRDWEGFSSAHGIELFSLSENDRGLLSPMFIDGVWRYKEIEIKAPHIAGKWGMLPWDLDA